MRPAPDPLPSSEDLLASAIATRWQAHGLARRLGLSQRQLERRFQIELRCPPHRWLEEQRLWLARRILKEQRPVKEAARRLGFVTLSHFCRWFKQRTTLTPGEFVRMVAVPPSAPAEPAVQPELWRETDFWPLRPSDRIAECRV